MDLELPDIASGSDSDPPTNPNVRHSAEVREQNQKDFQSPTHSGGSAPSQPRIKSPTHSNGDRAAAGSCPFAALAQVVDSHGSIGSSGLPMMKHSLPTIDQHAVANFHEGDEDAGSGDDVSIPIACPMTGNVSQLKGTRRNSFSNKSHSSGGSHRSVSTRGKKSTAIHSSGAPSSRPSQGSSRGKKKARGSRRVGKKCKPPPFEEADVTRYAPLIKSSWGRIIELKGYFELGGMYYDTLFSMAPELQPLFTLERNEMGVKFVDMLASMVSVVESPAKLHEKLEDLSPMHIRKGVQAAYMPQMGAVLFSVLQQGLGAEFTGECKDAWGWVWTWLSKSMALTLAGAGQQSSLVIMSWDMALDNLEEEELGSLVFDTLIKTAPNFKSIFSRPRQVMAMKFIDMISTIVSFADDAERMKEQVRWLGVRHVKYGAKPHHTQILGQVLITVLEEAVGEEWSQEMEKAWLDLWNTACAAMMAAIKDAEQHGSVVEDTWRNVKKKSRPRTLGATVVTRLLKADKDMVARFSSDFYHAEDRRLKEDKAEGKASAAATKGGVSSVVEVAVTADDVSTTDAHAADRRSKRQRGLGGLFRSQKSSGDEDGGGGGGGQSLQRLRPFNREEAEEAFGAEVWGFLETVMTLLWEPEQMNERLIVLGTRFFQYGVRLTHLDPLGEAIHESLRIALACPCAECGKDEWKSHISDAWGWLWGTVCQSLARTIESAEADHPRMAAESWEVIKENHSTEAIGDVLFQELTREAPMVVHLFKRPKKLQSYMFMQAIETLVMFAEKPSAFFEGLRSFTIRHIKYGVKSEFVKPFGKAVMQGLEELAGDNWSADTRNAWWSVWLRLSSCVARSLNVGTNLITVSLVNGDLSKMQEAAACAPRGERISWLTRVEVNGTVMSPLYWAIQDGKFAIAQFMLQDLLAIRADRECYYYGREELFSAHPDLVKVICQDGSELTTDLLDGLMWHSQTVLDGRLRVNYYIKDLYSDPDEIPDAWKTPLAIFCLEGKPEMFMHPVLNKLLSVKWLRFGRNLFCAVQAFFVLLIALFTTGFLVYGCSCSTEMVSVRIATGSLSALCFLFLTVIILRQASLGQVGYVQILPYVHVPVARLLLNPWNLIRYVCMITTSVSAFDEPCWFGEASGRTPACTTGQFATGEPVAVETTWDMVVLAASALLLWVQLLQVLSVSQSLGTLSFAIGRLFQQLGRNLAIVFVLIVAFACALNALQDAEYMELDNAIVDLIRLTLGIEGSETVAVQNWSLIFVVCFTVLVQLGMFSILIAQLVKGYDELYADQEGNSRMIRAFQCVEVESFLSISRRKRYYEECGFDNPIEFDNGDEGPTGGIQVLEPASIRGGLHYVSDRIMRCTGTPSALDPWPATVLMEEEEL